MPDLWGRCIHCRKPDVSEENLKKLRWAIAGGTASIGILGALPSIGLGAVGIAAGSSAPALLPSIGAVTACDLYTKLQSLEETGMTTVLFGSVRSALELLASVAPTLGWCDSNCQATQ